MGRRLKVAFVGASRSPSGMPEGYWPRYLQYHMELPWYYAVHAPMDVTVTSPERSDFEFESSQGSLRCLSEEEYVETLYEEQPYDVVVHWRKWFWPLQLDGSRNVILSQDHSYGPEWLENVRKAYEDGDLEGILVFPTWHKENTARELAGVIPSSRLYEGLTFGVDTQTYMPMEKDPHSLLWASDPGRGLEALINPFLRLWSRNRRYQLTVTYPDYVKPESVARFKSFLSHPGVRHKPRVRNGSELWDLFNRSAILPYSSTFLEPSSRVHRQAQAAGCLVMYPPNMGSPSRLIENGLTGIVEDPGLWPEVIETLQASGRVSEIGQNARTFALTENWAVQARRFYEFFSRDR